MVSPRAPDFTQPISAADDGCNNNNKAQQGHRHARNGGLSQKEHSIDDISALRSFKREMRGRRRSSVARHKILTVHTTHQDSGSFNASDYLYSSTNLRLASNGSIDFDSTSTTTPQAGDSPHHHHHQDDPRAASASPEEYHTEEEKEEENRIEGNLRIRDVRDAVSSAAATLRDSEIRKTVTTSVASTVSSTVSSTASFLLKVQSNVLVDDVMSSSVSAAAASGNAETSTKSNNDEQRRQQQQQGAGGFPRIRVGGSRRKPAAVDLLSGLFGGLSAEKVVEDGDYD